jgi:hypothetical protein
MGICALPRVLALRQGARSEHILYGSVSDEQRRSSAKDRQPIGLSLSNFSDSGAQSLGGRSQIGVFSTGNADAKRSVSADQWSIQQSFPDCLFEELAYDRHDGSNPNLGNEGVYAVALGGNIRPQGRKDVLLYPVIL